MKIRLLIFATLFSATFASAQAISEKEMKEIRGSFVKDAPTTAIQNFLTNNKDINAASLNRDLQGKIDHLCKYRVNVKGITNQKSSGRCWMFTSLNVLRPRVMEKYNLNQFFFSHNYLYFWDIFEKSNHFLENVIATADKPIDDREVVWFFKTPVGDGGMWANFHNVAEKYGAVPESAMPETQHSENTAGMSRILNEKLRYAGYEMRRMAAAGKKAADLRLYKKEALKDVYRILALTLGEPPTQFTWRYKDKSGKLNEKQYTPRQFYGEIRPADYDPKNYIMIMNDPMREYYKVYQVKNFANTVEGTPWTYLNLPFDEITAGALSSIKANEPLYTSIEWRKQMDMENGIAALKLYDYETLFGIKMTMDKKAAIETWQTTSVHAVTLIGCDTDADGKPVKWEIENSHGIRSGNNGYYTLTNDWLEYYLFRIVIPKKYLSAKAAAGVGQKPVELPMWDWMF